MLQMPLPNNWVMVIFLQLSSLCYITNKLLDPFSIFFEKKTPFAIITVHPKIFFKKKKQSTFPSFFVQTTSIYTNMDIFPKMNFNREICNPYYSKPSKIFKIIKVSRKELWFILYIINEEESFVKNYVIKYSNWCRTYEDPKIDIRNIWGRTAAKSITLMKVPCKKQLTMEGMKCTKGTSNSGSI